MTAHAKTQNLLRLSLPVTALVKNDANPNKMAAREFDLLIDNIERTGLTDPILVRPLDYEKVFEIAAKFDMPDLETGADQGRAQVQDRRRPPPLRRCRLSRPRGRPGHRDHGRRFDEDQERFQLVRMNMIRGKLDPQAFFDLYNCLAPAYSDEVLQDAFGFADEAEFRKLIDQTAKALPDKNLQKKFKEAAEEIKTIDGLSKLLERDVHQVRRHAALRLHGVRPWRPAVDVAAGSKGKTMNALDLLGTLCIDQARTVDDVIGGILQLAAKGELKEHVDKVIGKTPAVDLPAGLSVAPTKDNLQKIAAL